MDKNAANVECISKLESPGSALAGAFMHELLKQPLDWKAAWTAANVDLSKGTNACIGMLPSLDQVIKTTGLMISLSPGGIATGIRSRW